jgi:hydrogenase 3 maturation protease
MPTSPRATRAERPEWLAALTSALQPLPSRPADPPRVAVLGIGNEFGGDDGVGLFVSRALAERLGQNPRWLILDAGTAPENLTGALRRFEPALVLMVDAAHMDAPPGSIAWLEWNQLDGFGASTHTLPPSVLAEYLLAQLRCRVVLLGIQVARLGFGLPLSEPVQRAGERVIAVVVELLAARHAG